jgi:hypothetical protein
MSKCKNRWQTTWKFIKTVTAKIDNKKGVQSLYITNILMNSCDCIATAFNKYFLLEADSIINNIKSDKNKHMIIANPLDYLSHCFMHPFPKLKWSFFPLCELEKIIKYLTTKNCYGYNEIPFKILKLSLSFIISPLTNICNKSLSFRVFPDRLKFSIVKPIYKNGDRLITSNIFCSHQILEKKWKCNEAVPQLFIDFEKAYDSVRREVVYNIHIEFGIPVKLVRLVKACLTEICSRGRQDFA